MQCISDFQPISRFFGCLCNKPCAATAILNWLYRFTELFLSMVFHSLSKHLLCALFKFTSSFVVQLLLFQLLLFSYCNSSLLLLILVARLRLLVGPAIVANLLGCTIVSLLGCPALYLLKQCVNTAFTKSIHNSSSDLLAPSANVWLLFS